MKLTRVAVAYLRDDGEFLLSRRAGKVDRYADRWTPILGRPADEPVAAIRTAVSEQTGLGRTDLSLVRSGDAVETTESIDGKRLLVCPSLFDCDRQSVGSNSDCDRQSVGSNSDRDRQSVGSNSDRDRQSVGSNHATDVEWVPPPAFTWAGTVPWLWRGYDAVRPSVGTVADDTESGSATISVRSLEVLRDEATQLRTDREADHERIEEVARALLGARPAMTAVTNRINRVMATLHRTASGNERSRETTATIHEVAQENIRRALDVDRRAARNAADRIRGERVATLSRSGTVLRALETASPEAVLVAESRPGREGVDVAERLAESTAVTLSTDAAVASQLDAFAPDVVLVGADSVLADGRVVNKVGTRTTAIAATREGIPVLVVAASDKISTGTSWEAEPRVSDSLYDGRAAITVVNPTFDVTPADCVDAVVTERGPLDTSAITSVAAEHASLADWQEHLD